MSLDLCITNSYYPEVFNILFNIIIYATDDDGVFEEGLLRRLLGRISDKEHSVMLSENILATLLEIYENISRLNNTVCNILVSSLNRDYVDSVLTLVFDNYR